jgi:NitT/TauT family transport system substrate-binding protein
MRSQKFVVLSVLSRYKGNRLIANVGPDKLAVQWFAGKRIGVTLGTNNQYMTELVLERAGIKAELVNLAPPDMVATLTRGDVDAASMFPSSFPAAHRALNTRYAEYAVPEYETTMVLAVSADVAAKRPEVVRKVLAALLKADELIKSDPAAAQRSMAAAVGGAMTVEQVQAAWPDYRIGMTLDQPLLDLLLKEGKWIAARGLVTGPEPSEDLFRRYLHADFLKPLAADRVTLK